MNIMEFFALPGEMIPGGCMTLQDRGPGGCMTLQERGLKQNPRTRMMKGRHVSSYY